MLILRPQFIQLARSKIINKASKQCRSLPVLLFMVVNSTSLSVALTDQSPTLSTPETESAFHLSELTGQARLFLNGTREFRELVPDRLVLLCV